MGGTGIKFESWKVEYHIQNACKHHFHCFLKSNCIWKICTHEEDRHRRSLHIQPQMNLPWFFWDLCLQRSRFTVPRCPLSLEHSSRKFQRRNKNNLTICTSVTFQWESSRFSSHTNWPSQYIVLSKKASLFQQVQEIKLKLKIRFLF